MFYFYTDTRMIIFVVGPEIQKYNFFEINPLFGMARDTVKP